MVTNWTKTMPRLGQCLARMDYGVSMPSAHVVIHQDGMHATMVRTVESSIAKPIIRLVERSRVDVDNHVALVIVSLCILLRASKSVRQEKNVAFGSAMDGIQQSGQKIATMVRDVSKPPASLCTRLIGKPAEMLMTALILPANSIIHPIGRLHVHGALHAAITTALPCIQSTVARAKEVASVRIERVLAVRIRQIEFHWMNRKRRASQQSECSKRRSNAMPNGKEHSLPMLKSKDKFCRRLENERVLVVTAETGSGKSTQLPQYAAEHFDGLVVCTQPRVIAAISLAHRVASEYDGTPVGRSVGYRVGITGFGRGHNRVPGTDIIFMTDGALVQAAAEDDQLRDVRVLIIDEAHERSLHTDIVMGVAKLLLRSRPTDFYVVISSATIQPEKFLTFFDRSTVASLRVPGRVFDVDIENDPPSAGPVEAHAVTTLLRLYDKHEGTTLVFLAGQREIEQAMGLFERKIPKDCVALPLYGALSLEEQQQVLQFDGGPNGETANGGLLYEHRRNIADGEQYAPGH